MDRKYFLNSMGMSVAVLSCVGCKKTYSIGAPTAGLSGINFTLDLTLVANALLLNNGGALITKGVIVAKTKIGNYIAVQQSCTHERYMLTYQSAISQFYCPNHGAIFSQNGTVTNGPMSNSLSVYNTTLTGTSLRVYS